MSKAYKISCRDDDHGATVRFAERGRDLRGYRPSDWCDCGFVEVSVIRAPSFDKYAPGPVSIEQYLSEGWYWNCGGCEQLLYEDDRPVIAADRCFCNRACVELARKRWPEDVSEHHESVQEFCAEIDQWLVSSK